MGLRLPDLDPCGGHPEVCRPGQLRAAAEGVSVHGGDDRQGKCGQTVEDSGIDTAQRISPAALTQLTDIRPGSENTLTPACVPERIRTFGSDSRWAQSA